jgi:hypothetical protein
MAPLPALHPYASTGVKDAPSAIPGYPQFPQVHPQALIGRNPS